MRDLPGLFRFDWGRRFLLSGSSSLWISLLALSVSLSAVQVVQAVSIRPVCKSFNLHATFFADLALSWIDRVRPVFT